MNIPNSTIKYLTSKYLNSNESEQYSIMNNLYEILNSSKVVSEAKLKYFSENMKCFNDKFFVQSEWSQYLITYVLFQCCIDYTAKTLMSDDVKTISMINSI